MHARQLLKANELMARITREELAPENHYLDNPPTAEDLRADPQQVARLMAGALSQTGTTLNSDEKEALEIACNTLSREIDLSVIMRPTEKARYDNQEWRMPVIASHLDQHIQLTLTWRERYASEVQVMATTRGLSINILHPLLSPRRTSPSPYTAAQRLMAGEVRNLITRELLGHDPLAPQSEDEAYLLPGIIQAFGEEEVRKQLEMTPLRLATPEQISLLQASRLAGHDSGIQQKTTPENNINYICQALECATRTRDIQLLVSNHDITTGGWESEVIATREGKGIWLRIHWPFISPPVFKVYTHTRSKSHLLLSHSEMQAWSVNKPAFQLDQLAMYRRRRQFRRQLT